MKMLFTPTRDEWLLAMSNHLAKRFEEIGFSLKDTKFRVSCGIPSSRAGSAKLKVIGECWSPGASADAHSEIFISPAISDSLQVAATLAHELIHAVVGNAAGHKGPFKKCALALGLTGKMTATEAGEDLAAFINEGIEKLGEYPHAPLDYSRAGKKKQTTRMLKVVCRNPLCQIAIETQKPYVVRMSRKVLDFGAPSCGCCGEEMGEEES